MLTNLFKKRLTKENIITKDFLRILTNCNTEIDKDFNLIVNHRGKITMIFLGNPFEIENFFNNETLRSNPTQKRLIFISSKKNIFEKKDKVALINSKLNNFLLIQNSVNINFEICYKNSGDKKNLWASELYNDINDLNKSAYWTNLKFSKKNNLKLVENKSIKEKVYLVGVSDNSQNDLDYSMDELNELCSSLDKIVVGSKTQVRKKYDTTTLIGKGVLNEILLEAKFYNADKIIFNKELLPHQAKKISNTTTINICDRTSLILEIFEKNAKSKEAHIQIELARLKYELPRLIGTVKNYSQIAGGIRSKGPGEKKLEQKRRYLRKRIKDLEREINNLSKRRSLTRSQRERNQMISATLIGYTCAGKSTLFNKLTRSNVTESTKAFSTLNPTTRKTYISAETQILLSDTVGFISDLPKDLVSSFRATLEEIGQSDILIHVVDLSDINFEEKILSVEKTLKDTGLEFNKIITVYNKIDLVTDQNKIIYKNSSPQQCVSSSTGEGIDQFKIFLDNNIKELKRNLQIKISANF